MIAIMIHGLVEEYLIKREERLLRNDVNSLFQEMGDSLKIIKDPTRLTYGYPQNPTEIVYMSAKWLGYYLLKNDEAVEKQKGLPSPIVPIYGEKLAKQLFFKNANTLGNSSDDLEKRAREMWWSGTENLPPLETVLKTHMSFGEYLEGVRAPESYARDVLKTALDNSL
jgi:hypothetical protein